MRVCIHRGAKEIGGSCVELECEGKYLLIDCGRPLDDDKNETPLPPVHREGLLGVLISHPHKDHYGLLTKLPEGIDVLMGKAARQIIWKASHFIYESEPLRLDGTDIESENTIQRGPFSITPYLVDHSAFDAYAFLIEAGGKRLFYSGDFRAHGRKSALFKKFLKTPPSNIDVLLMEGSSLTRLDENKRFQTEKDIEKQFVESFNNTSGLAMVFASAQNIDRIVSIYRACNAVKRKMVIDLYPAAILAATGNKKISRLAWHDTVLCPTESQRNNPHKAHYLELYSKHRKPLSYEDIQKNPSNYVLLFRNSMRDELDKYPGLLENAKLIYSQWTGYLEEGKNNKYHELKPWLEKHKLLQKDKFPEHGIEIIHTSGHADPATLKRFAEALKPKALVPIHSFAPEKYKELFANVVYHKDGKWWDIPTSSTSL